MVKYFAPSELYFEYPVESNLREFFILNKKFILTKNKAFFLNDSSRIVQYHVLR